MVGVTVYGLVQECHVTYGRGRLHNIDAISISTIELLDRRFQTFPDISLPEKLISYESRLVLRITHSLEEQSLIYRTSYEIKKKLAGEDGILLLSGPFHETS